MKRLLSLILLQLVATAHAGELLRFPPGFKWCVATSAHQIEGGNSNSDWWDWEKIPGNVKNADRSGAAADHWNRLEGGVGLLRDLGVGVYRFSIEWARIEPREGEWDWDAVEHYRRELALLRGNGLVPVVTPLITLHHFTHPRWFAALGAWESPRAPELFARYAAFVVAQLGDGVRDWITVNEPMVHLFNGYLAGIMPPSRKGTMKNVVGPMRGLLRAHAAAYHAIRKLRPDARIGMAHHLRVFDPPAGVHPLDAFLAGQLSYAFNWALAESLETGRLKFSVPFAVSVDEPIAGLKGTQDFLGVNYYSRDIVRLTFGGDGFKLGVPTDSARTDLGWEIYPEGFYRVLKWAAKRFPKKPIFITENGIADATDAKRPEFLRAHLAQLHRAIAAGVPVEGYCHWSLVDNFEWAEGFAPRFGLYEVDYRTFERRARPSALLYSRVARENAVEAPVRSGRRGD